MHCGQTMLSNGETLGWVTLKGYCGGNTKRYTKEFFKNPVFSAL